jgi:hypothetical protein
VFTYFYARLGLVGLAMDALSAMPRLVLCLLFFSKFYLFHAENLSTAVQLLNRLTAVAFPMKYDNVCLLFAFYRKNPFRTIKPL